MRLVSFRPPDAVDRQIVTGLLVGDEVVDLSDAAVGLPADMVDLLSLGPAGLERVTAAPRSAARRHPAGEAQLCAPVPVPPKLLAIGMNYRAHVAEMGRQPPEYQYWFNKQRTCVTGPRDPIVIPSVSAQVDYEGELAVVIGRRCRYVPATRAMEVVAGFCVINDVSTRDWQQRCPTFTVGKSFDSHGPLGPSLVSADEIGDPSGLRLRTWVNDECRQDSSTSDLIFGLAEMIEYLTTAFTLEVGDVLATGTPAGVGAGFDPPRWLVAGDRVRVEIEGLGVLENPVVAEVRAVPVGLE